MRKIMLLALALAAGATQAAPYVYVANNLDNTVSVIDAATNSVVKTIPVGSGPRALAINAAGTRLYVMNESDGSVSVIDPATFTVVGSVPLFGFRTGVAINAAGTRAYFSNVNDVVEVIDTATNTSLAQVAVPPGVRPGAVAINPAGTRVYSANGTGRSVSVIDTASNTVVTNIALPEDPVSLAVNPAGTRLYVGGSLANNFRVIDTATNAEVNTVAVTGFVAGIAFNPSGTRAYLTNITVDTVTVVDTATESVLTTIAVGDFPAGVAFNAAGTLAYVANLQSNTVSVIDAGSNMVIATIAVGNRPNGDVAVGGPAATIPGAPAIGIATAGAGQATVTFTAPGYTGGLAVTGYTVVSNPPGGVDSNAGTPGTSHIVTGLANGTAYTFTVRATNAVGPGPPSAASNSVTPFTVPSAPTGVTATAGNAQATVVFAAPASNGGAAISGYTVTSNPPGGVDNHAGSAVLAHVMTGLVNGTSYTFTVVATNAAGPGGASAASNSVTPIGLPGAPMVGIATPGNGQVTVSFAAPASDGGLPILGYRATCNPGGVIVMGSVPSITVTGLANGTPYLCSVAATNAQGTGPDSATVNATPFLNTFTGPLGTGTGMGAVSFTGGGAGCSFAPQGNGAMQSAFFIPLTGHPKSPPVAPPQGFSLPYGLLDFVLVGCTPGSAIAFTVTYPGPVGGTRYLKYGPTPGNAAARWYLLPATAAGNTVTFTIVDGGLGDDDLSANGTVVDQGGPGAFAAAAVPTLGAWAIGCLALVLCLLGCIRNVRPRRRVDSITDPGGSGAR